MQSKPSAFRLLVASLACLAVTLPAIPGCGRATKVKKITGKVQGTVTFNGQPVKAGTVSFEAKNGGEGVSADLDSSGKFTVADPVPIGTYIAVVTPVTLNPDEVADGKQPPPSDDIPEKYRSADTSDLTFEIKEGPNTFEVKMKPQAPSAPATE